MHTQSLDWGFAKFAPLDSLTASGAFLDKEGDIEATVRVVADFPTYKTLNMPTGSNNKKKSISRVISHKFTNKVRHILRHSFLTCAYSEPRLGFRQIRAP